MAQLVEQAQGQVDLLLSRPLLANEGHAAAYRYRRVRHHPDNPWVNQLLIHFPLRQELLQLGKGNAGGYRQDHLSLKVERRPYLADHRLYQPGLHGQNDPISRPYRRPVVGRDVQRSVRRFQARQGLLRTGRTSDVRGFYDRTFRQAQGDGASHISGSNNRYSHLDFLLQFIIIKSKGKRLFH